MSNRPIETLNHEENLSAQQPAPEQDARVPNPDADDRRPERFEATPNQGPPQDFRVKGPNKARFDILFTNGKRASGASCKLTAAPGTGLIGIATSRKIGDKPDRNRQKRRFREAFRAIREDLRQDLDYIVVVSFKAVSIPYEATVGELKSLVRELNDRWDAVSESS